MPFCPRPASGVLLVVVSAATVLAGCSSGGGGDRYDSKWGVSSSERVHSGGPVPKGGGRYKLGNPYKVAGRWYVPREDRSYDRRGIASWYGEDFHGRKTANGELYDMASLTAAHPTMPLPSYAYVTNLSNGRTVLVRVNDRGPYVNDRVIDLSKAAARALGYEGKGKTYVRVRYAGRAPLNGDDRHERAYLAAQNWARGRYTEAPLTSATRYAEAERSQTPQNSPAWLASSYRAHLAGK